MDIATHILADSSQPAPESMGQAFQQLAEIGIIPQDLAARMVSAVGFRNVAVHSYRSINWGIVHAITHEQLDDFRTFAGSVSRLLDSD